ncbi:hypothetical protein Y032_0180g813 [Ancylostoma ceylanicum]|uniref:SET domain-containing protein n=1 Tax=Ancylostoma ceylanicum TaxID=53326 RepID=A0A016SSI6_9BILA|nr:hypothetical protein Y032_0180g813 [Ancylostoma ceylanicum]
MSPDDSLQEFLDWSRKNGIVFDGLEIRSSESSGNGIFATRSFRTDEKFIQLPESLMITAGKIADMEKYAKILHDTRFFPTPFEMLTLFFCLEDVESSWYAPYLKVLPKTFTTPAYTGESIDAADLPLSVRDYWRTQQRDLAEMWKKIHEAFPQITHEVFLWAWHVVNTRCIYVENKPHPSIDNSAGDTLAVIPFVDMLNHDPQAKGIAMYDRYSNKYMVRAAHCVLEDEQVTVCYGPHDNARLWMEYGFTLPDNPNGKVILEHALFIALAKKVGVGVSSLHEQALQDAGLPCTLYLSDEGPSWALRVNMKILMLSSSDIKRWRELVYVEKPRAASLCSSDDEESELDEQELAERRILERIISELRQAVVGRLNSAPQETKWIWKEQVMIVDVVLSSFKR